MATSPISSYSTTRITGLASGMDTDSIIKNAMKAEQAKWDRLYQKNTTLEWKRDAYQDINSQLQSFRNKYMSAISDANVFSKSTYRAYKVSMADNKYFSVLANTNATISSHKVMSVKMAEYATITGDKYRNRVSTASGTSGLYSKQAATSSSVIDSSQVGDTSVALGDLMKSTGDKMFNFDTSDPAQTLEFSINGETFSFTQSDTVQDMLDAVNGSSAANVTMSINAAGQFSIESNAVGSTSALVMNNVSTDVTMFGMSGVGFMPANTVLAFDPDTTTLAEMESMTGKYFGFHPTTGEAKFKINGTEYTIDKNMTVNDVMDMINNDPNCAATVSMDPHTSTFTFRSKASGTNTGLVLEDVKQQNGVDGNGDPVYVKGQIFNQYGLFATGEVTKNTFDTIDRASDTIATAAQKMGVKMQLDDDGYFTFKINDVTFSFDPNVSLQTMIDTVNGNTAANVTMAYSQITDCFTFTSKETGKDATIKLQNAGSNAFGTNNTFFGTAEATATGTNAVVVIDGETVERSSNNFEIDGLIFNLTQNLDISEGQEIGFSVSQDVDSAISKVKAFVEEYNALVLALNEIVSEEVDYDYQPLTKEQRESLSESEIEKWDTESKKGLLRNDSMIRSLLTEMRSALYEKVGDTGLSAADIGLKTGTWDKYGQIVFDEDVFTAALRENPDVVATVMAGTSTATKGTDDFYKESGIITRFYNQMTTYENTIKEYNLANTKQAISDNEDAMDTLLERMYALEEKYYLQFAAMETMMTQYQSQSNWLTQQLSSLGS